MKVVVVESPAKAKTINKYLGRDYEVIASFGHIRDLPPKDGSVDPEQDFHMVWELEDRGSKRVSEAVASWRCVTNRPASSFSSGHQVRWAAVSRTNVALG